MGTCSEIRLRNVASLVTAVLYLDFDFGDGDEWQKESSCLKQLLHSVARVENLELVRVHTGTERMAASTINFEQLALPGICRFL
ncbi:hypothetical protein RND71_032174 [Anisodus tanguticus]|uniref:Uncharacterized protein n=1 Tax=Anisodus tanguticus TaxID=243964 RepID=A0AAE1V5L0_9SOLA|nr:hypothetical protein RND71_032174 [Anisodus tanguticus]